MQFDRLLKLNRFRFRLRCRFPYYVIIELLGSDPDNDYKRLSELIYSAIEENG